MSSRLMPAIRDVKALISKAEQGDRTAALELARAYQCDSVTELIAVICPLKQPSVLAFDTAADAMALKVQLGSKTRPVLDRR